MALKALAFNCTLKSARDKEKSSTEVLLRQLLDALAEHDIKGETVRAVDHAIKPGVRDNEGRGDDWPKLRKRLLAADIVIIGTPVWLGQSSSVAKRVMERMDAFIHDLDDQGRMPTFGKVALVCVVGNEDGAHHVSAEMFQALNDCGFTLPAAGMTYWVGEAMGAKDYKELWKTPKVVAQATALAAANAAHLAKLLKKNAYKGVE
ncbi:MAG: flavodoxin family protein [Pseudorhodoplanes sp.]